MDIRPAPASARAFLPRLRPERRLFQVAWLGLTAVLVSVTLLYCALFWKLWFVDTPRYVCSGHDCPRGMGWLAALIPLLGTAAGLLWAGIKNAPLVRRSPFAQALAITLALVALWPGWSAYTWMRGPQMDLFGWQNPVPPAAQPIGVWTSERGGALVRARPDGLIAYNGEGRKGWRLPASEQTPVCALSRTTPSDIGLVAYQDGGRCGTRIEAVDLGEGRSLWDRKLKPSRAHTVVAAAGTTAVVAEEGALVGLDLRGGEERWRVPVPAECEVQAVDGAGDRALYVEQCSGETTTARISAVDARTGAGAWQTPLPTTSRLREVRVLSARPLAVHVTETAARGTDAVLLFGDDGRPRGVVLASSRTEDLLTEPSPVVAGDLLVTPVKNGKKNGVSAYSLTDGRRAWHAGFGGARVRALARTRTDEVAVVTSDHPWTHLTRLGLDRGNQREEPTILRDLPLGKRFAFFPGPPGSYAFVNLDRSDTLPPTFDVDPVFGW
ncbi:PQQ-like beta-propeller repeat protein [Streptomyces sp. NBC_01310]|uniref:outer membrane protein assembly factor BamB family protein n=1 Tax=Streptomyces sp. NBC_01310 TaxID=2903820 RepID=UPI0035B5E27C|nr:PQQ-like beta-propeller repeat protein [Streptomyces sp. NBC_01310]